MKLTLVATNYINNKLVGFTFIALPSEKVFQYSLVKAKQVLSSKDNLVYGLGLDNNGNFYGTNGNLKRYTKINNNLVVGVTAITILARAKDKYLIHMGYEGLTYRNYTGIISLLNKNIFADKLSNARINTKGFISPIYGNFYVGDLKYNGGVRSEKDDKTRSTSLGKTCTKESTGEQRVDSSREDCSIFNPVRKRTNSRGNSRVYFYDGLANKPVLSSKVKQYLKDNKFSPNTDSSKFSNYIEKAKSSNRHGACVDLHSEDEYKRMNCISFDKGKAGVAVHNGNITSVFKHDDSSIKGFIKLSMLSAICSGGVKLDCYSINGMLPSMYTACGMIPVCRVAFNKEFAPSDWDYSNYGEPDIVFMMYCGDSIDELYKNYGNYKPFASYTEGEIPLVEDLDWVCAYDVAIAIRDYRLNQLRVRGERHE